MEADVVVIGAGAAGMAAARKLAGRSRRVVVLEARDRIGSGPALVTAVIEMRVLSLLRTAVRSVLDALPVRSELVVAWAGGPQAIALGARTRRS